MLQYIKKYIKGWLLGILLFFIFISFAFWGVGDIFRQNASYIAKVGKDKITRDEFLIEYQFRINAMENKDLSKNERTSVANQALNNLTNRYLFLNMANDMGIKISKNVLKKNIVNNEIFHKKDGEHKFDENRYRSIVLQSFGSEERYLKYLENEIITDLLSNHFFSQAHYPTNLSKKIYDYENEKKSFVIASIDKILEQKKIQKPNKQILENFFKKNEDSFFFNERRSFTYIYIDTEILSKSINIDNKEIEDIYNQRKEEFVNKEKRDVEQLVFDNKNDAEKAFDSLKKGEPFSEVGKKTTGNDMEVISFSLVEKNQLLEEFAENVFLLKNNQFTEPVKTDIGWHILKVTKIIKEEIKPIKLVEDQIKKEIINDRSYDELEIILEKFEDDLSKGNSLEDIAKKLNLKIGKRKLMEKKYFLNRNNPAIFSNKKFVKDIFEKEIDDNNFIIEIENEDINFSFGFFITRVDKIVKKTRKNFEEAFDDIFNKWSIIEANTKVKNKVKKFNEKIEKNNFVNVCDELKIDNRIVDLVNKNELFQQGFPEDFIKKLFKANKDEILELDTKQTYYLAKVTSVTKNIFDENDYDKIKKNIEQEVGMDNLEQLGYIMRKKFPIKINTKIFNSFISTIE